MPDLVTPIGDDEVLARFIFSRNHFRPSDHTIKAGAFMPPPNGKLSMFRHIGLTEKEIWDTGAGVAQIHPDAQLCGRADIMTKNVRAQKLAVKPSPPPKNHVDITGWLADRAAQKNITQELAARSHLVENPS